MTIDPNAWRYTRPDDDDTPVHAPAAPPKPLEPGSSKGPPEMTQPAFAAEQVAVLPKARSKATTIFMVALGGVSFAALGAMMAFNAAQDHVNDRQLTAFEEPAPVRRPAVQRGSNPEPPAAADQGGLLERLASIMQSVCSTAGDGDQAAVRASMDAQLQELRPLLAGHAAVFEEVVGSDRYALVNVRSAQECDDAMVAFVRLGASMRRVNEGFAGLPARLQEELVARAVPEERARALADRMTQSVAADVLVQRLDVELADATVEIFTLLHEQWGAWQFGDPLVVFEDPVAQSRFDSMLIRVEHLEQRHGEAMMHLFDGA